MINKKNHLFLYLIIQSVNNKKNKTIINLIISFEIETQKKLYKKIKVSQSIQKRYNLMQTSSENNQQFFIKTSSIQSSQNDTQILKQKMKQLQLEIQNLQKLKRQNKTGSKMSNYSKNQQKKNQQKFLPETHRTNDQQQDDQMSQKNQSYPQPLKDFSQNFKNNKITNLMSQLSSKDQLQKNKKRLLSTSLNNKTNKQTLNDLKHKLQKTNKYQNPRKNIKINIMELKGAVHQVDSNIFNVTVAEIMTQEHEKYEMIKQIKELKEKLKSLEQKKRQSSQKKRIMSNLEPSFGEMFRSQNEGAGKIFNSSKMNNFRKTNKDSSQRSNNFTINFQDNNFIQQQRKSIQLKKSVNPLAWNPQISLTTNKPIFQNRMNKNSKNGRFYSTINIESHNLNDSFEKKEQSNKKPLFKILKKKFTNQSTKQQIQKPIQQKKPLQLLPQMKLQKFKSPSNNKIPQNFIPNFRQYIKQKILQFVLPPQPHPYDSQADLESLGIILFSLFDIYVQQQTKSSNKGVEYKVTKYKNCVLFRLNDQKNVVWYYDGKFYFGGWDISLIGEGKKEGFGIQIVPATYIYQGFFVNNKRQGYGIMINNFRADTNRNMIYEGNWKEGFKNGKGYQIQEELEYLGDFLEGLQTGKCKIRTKNTFYEGDIKESIKQGTGYQILKNGDQYYGQFIKNMFQGLGQYKWKSGAYFYGQFYQGLRKGYGIWISKLESDVFDSYKGQYNQNKKNGYGIYQWANGTIYQGYFKNDLRHDQGLMKYPNGKAGKFIWKDGNKAYKIYCQEQQIYRKKNGLTQSKSKIKINEQDLQNLQKQQINSLENIPRPALEQLQEKLSSLFLYKTSFSQQKQ